MLFNFWAFSTWIGVPAMQTIVAGLSEDARGTMLALNTSAQSLGQVVGPIVTGQVLVLGGFALAGPYAALVGLVALALAYAVLPRPVTRPAVAAGAPIPSRGALSARVIAWPRLRPSSRPRSASRS